MNTLFYGDHKNPGIVLNWTAVKFRSIFHRENLSLCEHCEFEDKRRSFVFKFKTLVFCFFYELAFLYLYIRYIYGIYILLLFM